MRYLSHSVKETEFIGYQLAVKARKGDCYALFGDLGRGKTAFVRGFAKGLGYAGDVSSPTFTLINEYLGGRLPLYHFDMYRIETFEDLYQIGFFDYIEGNGILIIEWSENIETALPQNTIRVEISFTDHENERIINISEKDE